MKKRGMVWRDETLNQIQIHLPQANSLKSHSVILERKFACDFEGCQHKFSRLEHLNRHKRKHTGEKPFGCPVPGCGKNFSRYDNMTQHLRSHESHRFKKEIKKIEKESKGKNVISFIDSTRLAAISFENVVNEVMINSGHSEVKNSCTRNHSSEETYKQDSSPEIEMIKEPNPSKEEMIFNFVEDSSPSKYFSQSSDMSERDSPAVKPNLSESTNNFQELREILQEPKFSIGINQKNSLGQFLVDHQVLQRLRPFLVN